MLLALTSRRHDLPTSLAHDSRLLKKGRDFFLNIALPLSTPRTGVPVHGIKKPTRHWGSWLDNQEPNHSVFLSGSLGPCTEPCLLYPPTEAVVAIDPSVCTFATLYDLSGVVV